MINSIIDANFLLPSSIFASRFPPFPIIDAYSFPQKKFLHRNSTVFHLSMPFLFPRSFFGIEISSFSNYRCPFSFSEVFLHRNSIFFDLSMPFLFLRNISQKYPGITSLEGVLVPGKYYTLYLFLGVIGRMREHRLEWHELQVLSMNILAAPVFRAACGQS